MAFDGKSRRINGVVRTPGLRSLKSPPREGRGGSEIVLNPEQAVVFGEPLGTGHRTDLDLTGTRRHGKIGDGRVLGLARSGRNHGHVAISTRQEHGIESFRERPNLVQLDQDRVRRLRLDTLRDPGWLGGEQIIADELNFAAEPRRERLPTLPVVLGEPVLDRDDRKTSDQ